MQHHFIHVLRSICSVSLTPVIASCVCENIAIAIKCSRRNGRSNTRVPLEPMLSIFIPKVECAIRTCSAKGAMYRMEADSVHRIDVCGVTRVGKSFAMTFEGEVRAVKDIS